MTNITNEIQSIYAFIKIVLFSIFRLLFSPFNIRLWSTLLDAEYLLIIQMKGILISCELNPIWLIDSVIIIQTL